MKNLLKSFFVKIFFGSLLLLTICNCKSDEKPKYEDFKEDDFIMVPGIVTKITRTPIFARGGWNEYNLYYAYNLDSDTILVGKEMDADLALKEGDGFYVLVLKNDREISFVAGPRLLPKDQRIIENYLKKSKAHGVKYYGIDEP